MKEKVLIFVFMLLLGCWMLVIGFHAGKKATRAEYAEKFPHVENFQPPNTPLNYGDISLIGSAAFPCTEQPCALMWNGEHWIKLVPE
jgi:hypothetical protein